ncbi:MAG: sodium:proline symporter [Chlamydiae bacterium RIFCSPHIGHO2_12_FULL_44_59]|nr:MAG: sodium:proline symporter [Chlamydiae bacterium RIFCSPHIGHO2_01_FULL_44_39]OGN57018.1 MAG: sodium:proline symporter [Chlamydiae bacterium RIFCSPHIGHO2_02_FULL_45_9]OGN59618.1 MAG: sodium:proline symporter [Chlamydiae bacterium RIFCSPHIGHO2_12_FULL_44_59]OGN65708.1 MAG: sodium:proline symporter [Chlamydiae bacterium RIFCSPLOWO2_01_FULL_44_52]OGN67900.1 MAG: sodium:proline symporter [Chlamydiae bacterium RIFCSPLOWO2_02_FULL_45_22]OGN69390.1 MAG: sodium:proline symporter [Chlamydiae bacter
MLVASFLEVSLFAGYFLALALVVTCSYRKQQSDKDFLIGNRSLNFWLTALSAHASDMSSWLFLGYPALIFTSGLFSAWAAIGLTLFMFLNWQFIAPKIRIATEQMQSLTLSSYFETRFSDKSGSIRLVSGAMSILFFTFYITSGLVGMGLLVESLLNLPYVFGITLGIFIVMAYVFLGGYRTIAWIDLFQGFFLLGVILFIPAYLIITIGGISPIMYAVKSKHLSTSLFPNFSFKTFWDLIMISAGWGLGYFGQPHILTKFMGIRRVEDMHKAKYLGISWQALALLSATLIGLLGIYIFPQGLSDSEQVILNIVKTTLLPFIAGLVICAILAATTNVMAAQILVVASNISEDFYKRIFHRHASAKRLLFVSRASVLWISCVSFGIAYFKISTIYTLVLYSWSGLGASFGPLLLLSLYRKNLNKYGAFAGILVGGLTAAIWPYFETTYQIPLTSLILAFFLSMIAIEGVSYVTRRHLKLEVEP